MSKSCLTFQAGCFPRVAGKMWTIFIYASGISLGLSMFIADGMIVQQGRLPAWVFFIVIPIIVYFVLWFINRLAIDPLSSRLIFTVEGVELGSGQLLEHFSYEDIDQVRAFIPGEGFHAERSSRYSATVKTDWLEIRSESRTTTISLDSDDIRTSWELLCRLCPNAKFALPDGNALVMPSEPRPEPVRREERAALFAATAESLSLENTFLSKLRDRD
ncbi:MAG: hypothetical protein JW818_15680 [Pirellulales bacterium]|nr:hypothetical protein [Pirellulales bacterium]